MKSIFRVGSRHLCDTVYWNGLVVYIGSTKNMIAVIGFLNYNKVASTMYR